LGENIFQDRIARKVQFAVLESSACFEARLLEPGLGLDTRCIGLATSGLGLGLEISELELGCILPIQ